MTSRNSEERTLFACNEDTETYEKNWVSPDQRATPLSCQRRLTDGGCLFLFITAFVCMVLGIVYAMTHGSLESYFGFTDYSGNICGASKAVISEHYMFLCQDGNGGLDEAHPLCVTACPLSKETTTYCPGKKVMPDYPTREYAGRLCMPLDPHLSAIVMRQPGIQFFLMVGELLQDLWPIGIAAVLAVLLGFAHLFLLRRFGMCFVWIGFLAMIGVPLAFGIYLIMAYRGGVDAIIGERWGDGGILLAALCQDEHSCLYIGICSCLLSVGLAVLVCCEWRDLLVARMTTKAAVECILDTLGLLVEPFVALVIRGAVFVLLVVGFLDLAASAGGSWDGFELSWYMRFALALYVVVALWILFTLSALSQYVAAVVTEEWFFAVYNVNLFSKDLDPQVMMKAYASGLTSHMGSIACGAFILPVIRGPRIVLMWMTRAAQLDNAVGGCINQMCNCALKLYHDRLECLNRSAYFEIALNSLPFSPASIHALEVLSDDATDVLTMHGATWLIELGGAGGITAICVVITHVLCTWSWFSPFHNPASPYHVANPILVDITAAAICCPIALTFLFMVSHVADCILFCCAVDRARNPVYSYLEDAGSTLLSRLNVCASDRPKKQQAWSSDNVNQLPNTRALLSMVTRDRESSTQKDSSGCAGRACGSGSA